MENHQAQIRQVYMFLTAYNSSVVENAIELWNENRKKERQQQLKHTEDLLAAGYWKQFPGSMNEIPKDHEWTMINEKIFIRSYEDRDFVFSKIYEENEKIKHTGVQISKQDLSMKKTDKQCPLCGEMMVWEPVCGGCKLGKIGFGGRYVCMDDMTHEFYVLRQGVESLPNRD